MTDLRRRAVIPPRPWTRRKTALLQALLLIVLVLAVATLSPPAAAPAPAPTIVLGRNSAGEFQGVRGANFLAWQQNTRQNPDSYNVFARPIDGGKEFRVNARGTGGANGGIDGDRLVYQEFEGGRSDIRFFDLARKRRSSPPKGVNTSQWEYWPSISGDLLLFGRLSANGVRKIVLFDIVTGDGKILGKVKGARSFLAPGQVNGDWATWARCPAGGHCDVILYNIADGKETTIPNAGREQRAPSVAPDGTVYFARAKNACGTGVRLVSYPPDGPGTELWRLPGGDDIGTTRVYVDPKGQSTVYFDQYACDRAAVSDVWEMTESGPSPGPSPSPTPSSSPPIPPPPGSFTLTVSVGGTGTGTVTATRINCPGDCTDAYTAGTDVLLTATPADGSVLTSWSGAGCAGSGSTCLVTMDQSKSVTVTFDAKPNNPPVVTSPGDQTSTEGDSVNLPIQATDPDSDTLTYSATGLPPGLSIDPNTGVISGTIGAGASAGSPYSADVSASDGQASDSAAFTWTVNAPPPPPP